MPSNNELLLSRSKRRLFFLCSLLAITTLLCCKYYIIPSVFNTPADDLVDVLNSLTNNLIVALFTSLSISAIFLYISESRTDTSKIEIIEPYDLKQQLDLDLINIQEFRYRGHTAKWTVAVTLPKLAQAARDSRVSKKVFLEIIDPRNEAACKKYVNLKRKIDQKNNINISNVKTDLVSTIISSFYWTQKEPLLDISVGLTNKVSLFRADLTSNSIIITTPYAREISIRYDVKAYPFKLYREELIISFEQSTILSSYQAEPLTTIDEENVKKFLISLNFDILFIDSLDLSQIISFVNNPINPFPN